MHPYREPGRAPAEAPAEGPTDDRMIAGVVLAVGALRVAVALAAGEAFGAEASIAAGLAILGAWGLIRRRG